ncbi:hypothetical protein J7E73_05640 [Paenibacillus albidus]|uniref:hypothetical protein n=1 Tax=Paenibacillus albidus TaxID=2041023 RepID=UPI001BEB9791|nr:hypothetical protein [Paenibacillus albidus]MBT2288626.1 hypothetical protein [Paenibacillus albidus]
MRAKRKGSSIVVLLVLMALIAGCGGGDSKNTVTVFMMVNGINPDTSTVDKIEGQLADKLGEETKVEFNTTPMYNIQKLMVEYAAAMNDIIILSKDDVLSYGKNGANLPLDDYFNPDDYPEGVFEGGVLKGEEEELVQEKHLYAIPLSKLKMFKDAGFAPEDVFLTLAVSSDSIDQSVKAIQSMME